MRHDLHHTHHGHHHHRAPRPHGLASIQKAQIRLTSPAERIGDTMATRINNDVTIQHDKARAIARMLSDYAREQNAHARRTRSEAIRDSTLDTALMANELARYITERLWSWQ